MKLTTSTIVLGIMLLASACKKDKTATEDLMETEMAGAVRTHSGLFVNGPYGSVSGAVHVVKNTNGTLQLVMENLRSSNGPDLQVYLSKEVQPVNFINLGALKSVNGNQVYNITGTPDFADYKFALIHCKAFNHLFGSAPLVKN
jgi:hypothetical protein